MGIITDVIYIASTHAFLHIDDTLSHRMRLPQKIRYQRLHPGRIEKHRGIIFRYKWSGRNNGVTTFLKKIEIFLAEFC